MATIVPAQKEDRNVFTFGPRGYSVRDVIDAAFFLGEIEPHWQEVLLRSEAQREAQDTGAQPDDAALESAAVAFRYRYELITAEETERWLEMRGLTLVEFSEHFAREYWRGNFGSAIKSPDISYAAAPADLHELLVVELVLSGELDRMATNLAWRVASRETAKENDQNAELLESERANFQERFGLAVGDFPGWLSAFGRDEAWLDEMLAAEAAYRARCERLLTDEARQREVSALRLPLTRFDVEMLELESRDAAREAFLCIRDDGMSMAEVAQESRYPFHRTQMVLEEIAPDLQQKFLSLTEGSLLEPTPREDGFLLTRILGKHEPTLQDPGVQERVDALILKRHFSDLASGRIQWSIMPGTEAAE